MALIYIKIIKTLLLKKKKKNAREGTPKSRGFVVCLWDI